MWRDLLPTLTVGMPVYNGERYLEAAAESVLAQSFRDLEVVISDNASTDETEAIGRALASRDPRVTYRRNGRNVGLSANFNLLVPLARGRLFKWGTADDVLRPGFLERCIAAIDADPSIVLAYAKTDFVDGDDRPLDIEDPGWHLVADDPYERIRVTIDADSYMNATHGVIRADALRRTHLVPAYAGGDYRLLAELAALGKIVEVPERLFIRRIHRRFDCRAHGRHRLAATVSARHPARTARPYWRLCRDQAGVILHAPTPPSQRALLLIQLARTMRHRWRRLRDELVELTDR